MKNKTSIKLAMKELRSLEKSTKEKKDAFMSSRVKINASLPVDLHRKLKIYGIEKGDKTLVMTIEHVIASFFEDK